jgi:hypothetical protein
MAAAICLALPIKVAGLETLSQQLWMFDFDTGPFSCREYFRHWRQEKVARIVHCGEPFYS